MKRILIALVVLIFSSTILMSQPELKTNQFKGFILTKKGKQEGIVWVNGHEESPWGYQKKVRFMPMKKYNKVSKLKKKYFENYKPKDIKGYGYDDVLFLSGKYSDMSAIGTGMFPKWYFFRVKVNGKIQMFEFYQTPPPVFAGKDGEYEKIVEECRTKYQTLVRKEDGKLKNVSDIDFLKMIDDCSEVKDKYLAGEYGMNPKDNEEKKGVGKFIAKVIDNAKLSLFMQPIVEEYNETCP